MNVLTNKLLPPKAFEKLKHYANIIPFDTENIVPQPLSGHADIFCTTTENKLIIAPNIPEEYINLLKINNINFVIGKTFISKEISSMGAYNVLIGKDFYLGNTNFIDPVVKNELSSKKALHCRQGFARCSSICIGNAVLTSDAGISKVLSINNIPNLLISQETINLPGYRNGCFGGACGFWNNKLFITGNLRHHPQNIDIQFFVESFNIEIVELCDTQILDIGSMLFF